MPIDDAMNVKQAF